ncbi:MAG: TonB-dependent receptor [Prevotellaceae bacterium]|nr:TonB-dependent receptor [Prevotellaceae bacterium]
MDLIKSKKAGLNILLKTVACMLFLIPSCLLAQTGGIAVKGQVTVDDQPLAGVTVMVQGTSRYAMTDDGGNYSITAVDQNSVLVFSFIGYKTVNETVGARSVINIAMEEDVQQLEQTVVIGYGTQRKEAVTGSVISMGGETIKEVAAANLSQALQGRFAGIEMTQTNSQPGAQMQIRVRGQRSLNASNDPLIVLDGIPLPSTFTFSDINPNDVKSVDILKDASATGIYGSRGANGVILITTNKGTIGQKPIISYNGYVGAKTLFAEYPMMTGPEFLALREAAGTYHGLSADEKDNINTNWQDLFYKTGLVTNHDVGISGGAEQVAYNFGLGYYREESMIPTQNYSRISLRGTIDQQIGKYFRFGITTNNSYTISNGMQIGLYGVLNSSPLTSPYDEDGNLKERNDLIVQGDKQFVLTKEVVESLEENDKWLNQSKGFGTYNNIFGEVKVPWVEGLKYKLNLGLNFRMSDGGSYTGIGVNSSTSDSPSTASISRSFNTSWTIENLITYDRTFAEKHQVNVVGLFSAEQNHYHSTYISARNIPADFLLYYNLGMAPSEDVSIDPNFQGYEESALISWMGRVIYSYDGRYMLSAAFRSDASSRLAPGYQWHTYPAVSLGWNIHKEKFMENVSFINSLKLRAGYGETSNESTSPYATLGQLSTRFYNFDTNYQTGYYVSQLPNPTLGWEYSETWNYGMDFTLLKNRLSGTIEYYVQNTHDVLIQLDLPRTSGVSARYWSNMGQTQNKGFELSLNGVILENLNGWHWEAGINLYTNKNKIVALASGATRDINNGWFVGYPIDVLYTYEMLGLWQKDDPDFKYLSLFEGDSGNEGMIKVRYFGERDVNGAPTRAIGDDDRVIRKLDPDFQGGFNTNVNWKNFDLTIVGAFKSGGTLISTLYGSSGYLNQLTGRRGQVSVDYWTPENTGAKYPKPGGASASAEGPRHGDLLNLFDASYVKIRTITLGYNFEQKWVKDAGIKRLRLYASVQNPFVLFSPYHNETGMDPEPNSYGTQNQAVGAYQARFAVIGTNAPQTRTWLLGINLTF